jgi:hypothetical protein
MINLLELDINFNKTLLAKLNDFEKNDIIQKCIQLITDDIDKCIYQIKDVKNAENLRNKNASDFIELLNSL